MSRPFLPEPPLLVAREPLTPELEDRVKRLRWKLLFVPYAFVGWVTLRRESPEAARRLRLEVALNAAQSVLVVLLLALAVGLLLYRQPIVDALASWLIDSALVR